MAAIYRDGHVHVREKQCDRCLLSKDRLVPGGRARQIIEDTRAAEGSSFICHRNLVSDEPEAICRAWWDRFADEDSILRLAMYFEIVRFV